MNRKHYASEYERSKINRSWHNDFSDENRFNRRKREPPSYSKSLARHRNRSTTLDDIDKVNRYVEVLSRNEEFDERNVHSRPTRPIERPRTPPPPVISFRTDRTINRSGVEVFDRLYPHSTRKSRRNSVEWSPNPQHKIRRNSMERSRSPSPRRVSFNNNRDPSDDRRLRRRSIELDPIECNLSPLELLFNRGTTSTYSYRRSPVEEEFEEIPYQQRQRWENERRNSLVVNRSHELDTKRGNKRKDLVLTIIDEGSRSNNFTKLNWNAVESALCMIYLDIMRDFPGPPPVCREAGWFLGCAKVIECADERSVRLFKLAISRVGEVWTGARLKVVNRNEIKPSHIRLRCVTFVPANPADKQAILERIQISNPDLPTSDWRVTNVGAPSRLNNERHVTIAFGIESLSDIEKRHGIIKYGFGTITVKVNRQDKKWANHVLKKDYVSLENLDIRSKGRKQQYTELETEEAYHDDDADKCSDYSSE